MQSLQHVDLRGYHTLAAPLFADSLTLIDAEEELAGLSPDTIILGRGSNIIFADHIHTPLARLQTQGWHIRQDDAEHVYVAVKAGQEWHDFVRDSVMQGWQGLENLALIPGTVGAAPVQNIGAYGVEVGQFIENVTVFDRHTRSFHRIPADECGFAYRYSHFKGQWKQRYIISEVLFRLNKNPELCLTYAGLAERREALTTPQAVMDAVIAIRQSKLPDPAVFPNAGSFFHNPVVSVEAFAHLRTAHPDIPGHIGVGGVKIPAAWLIEQCGLKGYRQGALSISPQHALVVVNEGGSGQEILQFAAFVQNRVREHFAIDLHIEPIIIGALAYAA